jgi:hypothetical protein
VDLAGGGTVRAFAAAAAAAENRRKTMVTEILFAFLGLLLLVFFGALVWLYGRLATRYSIAFHRLLRLLVVVGIVLAVLYLLYLGNFRP